MKEDELPIFNWVWFGLYRDENGVNGYTYVMDVFGKEEIEVLSTDAEPNQFWDSLACLVSYVLENDVELEDGETIGFSAEDKYTITRSPGVSLPEDQMTLKISWEPSEGGPEDEGEDDPPPETPSELARALKKYLDCECTYFPSIKNANPILAAYSYALRDSAHEGFIPVFIRADDEPLWELMSSDSDSNGEDDYAFNPDKVTEYRKKMLAAPILDSKAVLEEMIGQRREETEDDMDWEEEILGEMGAATKTTVSPVTGTATAR